MTGEEFTAGENENIAAIEHAMDSAREEDVNGFVEIKGNPLSKSGVYPYHGRSIPNAPDPERKYMVYRPEEELADPECIDSFKLLPWIDNHVMLGNSDDGLTPAEQKGVQGVIGEEVYFANGTLYGNLKVFSQTLANLIEAGKRELSCGYRCVYEWVSGQHNGQAYDVIQRKIRGNHLALVESGRMGASVAVLDGLELDHFTFTFDAKDAIMEEENKEGGGLTVAQALEAVKGLLPAIKMLQDAAAGKEQEPAEDDDAPDGDEVTEDEDDKKAAEAEAERTKPDDGEGEDKDGYEKEEKDGQGMDAAFRPFMAKIAARDKLAASLSNHVGVFDHAEMDVQQVAVYGCKKLGIHAEKGAEVHTLKGWLQGAKNPAKQKTVKTSAAMDSARADNFVARFLKKGV